MNYLENENLGYLPSISHYLSELQVWRTGREGLNVWQWHLITDFSWIVQSFYCYIIFSANEVSAYILMFKGWIEYFQSYRARRSNKRWCNYIALYIYNYNWTRTKITTLLWSQFYHQNTEIFLQVIVVEFMPVLKLFSPEIFSETTRLSVNILHVS